MLHKLTEALNAPPSNELAVLPDLPLISRAPNRASGNVLAGPTAQGSGKVVCQQVHP